MARRQVLAILAAIAGVALALAPARLNAQVKARVDCHEYAAVVARIAEYREVGAPLKGVLNYLRQIHPPGLVLAAVEREAKRVYAEALAPDKAAYGAYRRCQDHLGELGAEG